MSEADSLIRLNSFLWTQVTKFRKALGDSLSVDPTEQPGSLGSTWWPGGTYSWVLSALRVPPCLSVPSMI